MKWILQQLLSAHFDTYRQHHGCSLAQLRAVDAMIKCRTAALGGHVQCCENGHIQGVWYNSCRHRSCPQCNGLKKARWLSRLQSVLLNCPHHHMIFTLPSELHILWQYNRALMTDLMYQAVQQTLKTFSRDKRYLNAQPGIISTVHTWGRDLSLHPHIHCLISHGGLSESGDWVAPKRAILFPQKPLMMVFRGKLLALLKEAAQASNLSVPETHSGLNTLFNRLGRKEWVVHCCKRYDYGEGVATYLARYVRGGPFNPRQIKGISQGNVRFVYRSHQTKRQETAVLEVEQFIRRWLNHIPLPGKASVRYAGLYSSAAREKLNQARCFHQQFPVSASQLLSWQDYLQQWQAAPYCHQCGAPLYQQEETQVATTKAA
jgi:hypothetical protein